MYQRILVPIDGSPTSSKGLDEAIKLAKLTGASLRLLHVLDALSFTNGYEAYEVYAHDVMPYMKQTGQAILEKGRAQAAASGVTVDTQLCECLTERMSELVIEQSKLWPADLIVLGTHGRRGLGRFFLGSDAEQIVRTSIVPVLLVRDTSVDSDAALKGSEASVNKPIL